VHSIHTLLILDAPRTLPVTQAIHYDPRESREAAFGEALASAAELGLRAPPFRDRRGEEKAQRVQGWQAPETARNLDRGY
jgi:hypothetical protein